MGPAARGRQSARLRPLCSLPPSLSRSGPPTTSEVRRMGQERESRGRESVELWSMCVACAKTCASCSGTWIEAGLEHTFSAFHGCCQFEPVGRGVAAHGTSSLITAETCGCTEQRVSFVLHIAPCFVKFSIRTLLDLCGTAVLKKINFRILNSKIFNQPPPSRDESITVFWTVLSPFHHNPDRDKCWGHGAGGDQRPRLFALRCTRSWSCRVSSKGGIRDGPG